MQNTTQGIQARPALFVKFSQQNSHTTPKHKTQFVKSQNITKDQNIPKSYTQHQNKSAYETFTSENQLNPTPTTKTNLNTLPTTPLGGILTLNTNNKQHYASTT